MQNPKKTLSVAALADEIRKLKKEHQQTREMQRTLREKGYSFAKDKWNKAVRLVNGKPVAPKKTKPKPELKKASLDKAEDAFFDAFFDAVADARIVAELVASDCYKLLKKYSTKGEMAAIELNTCPAVHPELFRLLDLACESGLMEKHISYSLPTNCTGAPKKKCKAKK